MLGSVDGLVSDIVRGAHKEGETERLRTLHDLDSAALHLWDALHVLLDQTVKPTEIRPQTFARVPRPRLLAAGATVEQLTRPPDDNFTRNSSSATRACDVFCQPSCGPSRLRVFTLVNRCSMPGHFSGRLSTNANPTCAKRLWKVCHARGVGSSNRRVKPRWIGEPIPCVP
jgi:hypothetical protein